VSVQQLASGKHTWRVTVIAGDDGDALRAAAELARELDAGMTRVFITAGEAPAEGGITDDPIF
jgi:hypothetical protein